MYKVTMTAPLIAKAEKELAVKFLNKRKIADDDLSPIEITTNSAILYGYLLEMQNAEMFSN
jgi:hypothetical protein